MGSSNSIISSIRSKKNMALSVWIISAIVVVVIKVVLMTLFFCYRMVQRNKIRQKQLLEDQELAYSGQRVVNYANRDPVFTVDTDEFQHVQRFEPPPSAPSSPLHDDPPPSYWSTIGTGQEEPRWIEQEEPRWIEQEQPRWIEQEQRRIPP